MKRTITTSLVALALPAAASAQITYGTDDTGQQDNFVLDIGSGVSSGPEWTGAEAWGLADDDGAGVYYINDGAALFSYPIGSPGGAATSLGDMTEGGAIHTKTGMAFNNGVLYAHRNIAVEALYTVDLVTLDSTALLVYSTTSIDLGGLDFDPATGLLLGSNDSSTYTDPQGMTGRGVVTLDVNALTESLDYPYPVGETDIDGLAFEPSGVIYLLEDEPAPLHNYDINTMMFDPAPPMNSIAASEVFSAGTHTGGGSGGIGTNYCMANPNSTGQTGLISATGSDVAADNNVTLSATQLPPNAFGFFLASTTSGFVMNPSGSEGNICLSGAIGRYVAPGQIMNSGSAGEISLMIDTTMIPNGTTFDTAMSGDTFFFQLWHRDTNMGASVSNFTDGLQIDFN